MRCADVRHERSVGNCRIAFVHRRPSPLSRSSRREYLRVEDHGDPRLIARGALGSDCDRDVTEQAGSPSEERCHNVATTGVDSRGLPETGGHVRMAGT